MSDNHRIHFNFSVSKRLFSHTVTLLAGGLLFSAAMAFADGDYSTQTVVGSDIVMPYDGYLMMDSAPMTGTRTIKFDLYQVATGGTVAWTETQTVNLYNGRFSVGLGTSTSLTSTLLDAEKLYLAMTIIETDAQGNLVEIELSGRQSIEPAPFAAWATNSADFEVAGVLTVQGTATIGDDLTVKGDEIELGSSSQRALYHNASDQLYISPSKDFTGGVFVGNDFQTNYDTQLGSSSGSYFTTIYGPDSNGSSQSALQIKKSDGSTMYLDDNEIDSSNGLQLQVNTGNNITLGGNTYLNQKVLYLQDAAGSNYTLTGIDSSYDETGVELRAQTNPSSGEPIFTVLSSGGAERLRVEHDGVVHTDNGLSVDGSTTLGDSTSDSTTVSGDLTVSGDITNLTVSSEYYAGQANATGKNNRTSSHSNGCVTGDDWDPATPCSNSTAGNDISLGATGNRICFLTLAGFQDVDGGDERGICSVYIESGQWKLSAAAETGDANVFCNARCLSW